jgi:hypothetical protein
MITKEEVHTEFWWTDLRKRDHLYNLDVAEKIILKWVSKMWDLQGGLDWTDQA